MQGENIKEVLREVVDYREEVIANCMALELFIPKAAFL
jgi:hypothetical protein